MNQIAQQHTIVYVNHHVSRYPTDMNFTISAATPATDTTSTAVCDQIHTICMHCMYKLFITNEMICLLYGHRVMAVAVVVVAYFVFLICIITWIWFFFSLDVFFFIGVAVRFTLFVFVTFASIVRIRSRSLDICARKVHTRHFFQTKYIHTQHKYRAIARDICPETKFSGLTYWAYCYFYQY